MHVVSMAIECSWSRKEREWFQTRRDHMEEQREIGLARAVSQEVGIPSQRLDVTPSGGCTRALFALRSWCARYSRDGERTLHSQIAK